SDTSRFADAIPGSLRVGAAPVNTIPPELVCARLIGGKLFVDSMPKGRRRLVSAAVACASSEETGGLRSRDSRREA
ncbi:MAG TPA: hypothetical protein VII02_12990, partial [Gemmatimonadaceae bacterium]